MARDTTIQLGDWETGTWGDGRPKQDSQDMQDAPSEAGEEDSSWTRTGPTRRSGSNSLGAVVADYAASGSLRRRGQGGPVGRLSGLSGPCERRPFLSLPLGRQCGPVSIYKTYSFYIPLSYICTVMCARIYTFAYPASRQVLCPMFLPPVSIPGRQKQERGTFLHNY